MPNPPENGQGGRFGLPLTLAVAAVLALAAGLWLSALKQDTTSGKTTGLDDPALNAPITGSRRPPFSLPDLEGRLRNIAEWDGKVILLNFWATWCPPCQKEIPAFMEVREELGPLGFEVIGVAIDQRDAVADFVDGLGIPYPILQGEAEAAEIARRYGNSLGALPYSVVIDREGRIRYARAKELKAEELRTLIRPLLPADRN